MLHPRVLAPLAAGSALLSSSAEAASPRVLVEMLGAMEARGEIHKADLLRLRSQLDARPALLGPAASQRCWTLPVVQARSFAHRHGAHVVAVPPPPSLGFVQSPTLPLRVYYQHASESSLAYAMLAAAEEAWSHQVGELGAYAPYTDDEDGNPGQGLYLYVAATGMGGGGYTEWLSDVPATSRSDCSCRVVVDPANLTEEIPEIVYHEFVHATQMATDCTEAISAWENFAVAAEHVRFPDSYYFTRGFLPEFQRYPEYPVDYWTQNESSAGKPLLYFQYGAALFPLYLMERYGHGDAAYLAKLWQTFAQDGTVKITPWSATSDKGNEPDWFEGVSAALSEHALNLADAHMDFSVWRVAVAQRDDGQHFQRAYEYESPRMRKTLVGTSEFPVLGELETYEYGTAYVQVLPQGTSSAIRALVITPQEAQFSAEVVLWRASQALQRIPLEFDGGVGRATTGPLGAVAEVVLVLSQSQDLSHDPDDMDYASVRSVRYTLESVDAPDGGGPWDVGVAEGGMDGATDAEEPEGGGDAGRAVADGGGHRENAPTMLLESAGGGGCDCSASRSAGHRWPGLGLLFAFGFFACGRRRLRQRFRVGSWERAAPKLPVRRWSTYSRYADVV